MSDPAAVADPLGNAAFARYFREKIRPRCASVERLRRKAAADTTQRSVLAVAPVVLILWLVPALAIELGLSLVATVAGVITLLCGVAVWVLWPKMRYERNVKLAIWPVMLAFFGPDFRYYPAGRSPAKAQPLRDAGVLPADARWTFADRVSGSYRGVGLSLDEVRVEVENERKPERERGSRDRRTVFRGLAVTLDLRRRIPGKTIVLRDAGWFGNLYMRTQVSLSRVRLEDPAFERAFEVYSTDQIQARVLLTPAFMERLRKLSDHHDGKLQCSFHADRLYVFLATKHDFFEIQSSLYETATFVKEAAAFRRELGMIFELIEVLRLHQSTGL